MQMLASIKYLVILTLFVFTIIKISPLLLFNNISAAPSSSSSLSPSFVRQEIVDAPDDWQLWKGPLDISPIRIHDGQLIGIPNAKNISQCKIGDKFASPDIESISYISNGKILNATVWLTSNFEEPPLKDNIDIYPEQLKIKVSNLTKIESLHITLDKYATEQIAKLYNPLNNFTIDHHQLNSTTIAGNRAFRLVYSAKNDEGFDLKNMTLWTINRNKIYDITYSALRANYSDNLPIIQKMINSIDFVGSNTNSSKQQPNNHSSDDVSEFRGLGIRMNYPLYWEKKEVISYEPNSRTVIFRSPFEDELSDSPSWHETTFTMALALDSAQHAGVTDYRVIFSRNPINNSSNSSSSSSHTLNSAWAWTRNVTEVSAYDKSRVLEVEKNYGFYDKNKPYILFSFDLQKINFPQQYRVVFYTTDYFVLKHRFCRLIDTTNWVIIPPPEFTISTSPASVVLRPGDEKAIELMIKGNTQLPSEAFVTDLKNNNYNKDIRLNFVPNKVSILPPSHVGTSSINVKALDNSAATSYTLPIIANISFPTKITNRGGEVFSNSKSIHVAQASNLTLTILPSYTMGERLSNFINTWVTPITGVWTFLAGVGTVIAPLIISLYRKRQKKNK
jgi:hypothetical protein